VGDGIKVRAEGAVWMKVPSVRGVIRLIINL